MAPMKRCGRCCIRQMKCDRKEPCSHCIENTLKCIYIMPLRKRGPRSISERSVKRIAEIQMNTKDNNVTASQCHLRRYSRSRLINARDYVTTIYTGFGLCSATTTSENFWTRILTTTARTGFLYLFRQRHLAICKQK